MAGQSKRNRGNTAHGSDGKFKRKEPEPMIATAKVKIEVEDEGIQKLISAAEQIGEAFSELTSRGYVYKSERVGEMQSVTIAPKPTVEPDPGEKQLHRRVRVIVYDREGTRITDQGFDLVEGERLEATVEGGVITSKQWQIAATPVDNEGKHTGVAFVR